MLLRSRSLDHVGAVSSAETPQEYGIYEKQMEAGLLQIVCVMCEHDKTHDAPSGSQGRGGENTTAAERAERAQLTIDSSGPPHQQTLRATTAVAAWAQWRI